MGLWRHKISLLGAAFKLIEAQREQLDLQRLQLARLQVLVLEAQRSTRDVAVGARIAAEEGIDISADLDALIADLSDLIANMEEHMVVTR